MQSYSAALVLVVMAVMIGHVVASRRFRTRILSQAARLSKAPRCQDVSARLPAIVDRFARRSGADPRRALRIASFNQDSEIRMSRSGRFRKTVAWQAVSLGSPGFVWDAHQNMGPLQGLRIMDAYVGREGRVEARLFGSVPVVRETGPAVSLGEAYRYLAELPWMPDAILGNPALNWRALTRDTVEVRMETPHGEAAVLFRFNADGDIAEIEAEGRPVPGVDTLSGTLDWRGRFSDYVQIGPRRLPSYGEIGYVYSDGSYEVNFRCRIRDYQIAG